MEEKKEEGKSPALTRLNLPTTRADVEDLIRSAFAIVVRGNGTTLHQARALDDWESDQAVERAARLDLETHWSQVPGTCLCYLCFILFDF